MEYRKAGFWQLLTLAMLMQLAAIFIHEASHWMVLEIQGKGPVFSFAGLAQMVDRPLHPNEWTEETFPDGKQVWVRQTSNSSETEQFFSLAAGPLASLLEVVFGLILVYRSRNHFTKRMGLILALVESIYAIQYYIRRIPSNSGDEYFLAAYFGISKYAISIPLFLLFITGFILSISALGEWKIRLKWLGTILLGFTPPFLFLMNANNLAIAQINQDNPLFQPLFGFSLPVIVVNAIVLVILGVWWKRGSDQYHTSTLTAG